MGTSDSDVHRICRLRGILEGWAEWMKRESVSLGYPKASIGFKTGGINCFDDLADAVDLATYQAVDAAIGSLPPVLSCAIHHCYLASVYRFGRMQYEDALALAHDRLIETLPKRGVVL